MKMKLGLTPSHGETPMQQTKHIKMWREREREREREARLKCLRIN